MERWRETHQGHRKGERAMMHLFFLLVPVTPIRLLGMVFQVEKACP
jgi:hypothetical protein